MVLIFLNLCLAWPVVSIPISSDMVCFNLDIDGTKTRREIKTLTKHFLQGYVPYSKSNRAFAMSHKLDFGSVWVAHRRYD